MRKELLERANNLSKYSIDDPLTYGGMLYFTKKPINNDARFKGKKYFICYYNTHTIKHSFKTQGELDECLKEYGF